MYHCMPVCEMFFYLNKKKKGMGREIKATSTTP